MGVLFGVVNVRCEEHDVSDHIKNGVGNSKTVSPGFHKRCRKKTGFDNLQHIGQWLMALFVVGVKKTT